MKKFLPSNLCILFQQLIFSSILCTMCQIVQPLIWFGQQRPRRRCCPKFNSWFSTSLPSYDCFDTVARREKYTIMSSSTAVNNEPQIHQHQRQQQQ
mmetsp:Transcript_14229/g.16126  ORF Transcript_14229/g.16126 Transcript_14229/m.16126 type:complete len:96 (-) Transcript_14229:17-304(-)